MTNWRQAGPKITLQYLCTAQKGVQGAVTGHELGAIWQPILVVGEAVVCHPSSDALGMCPAQRNCSSTFAILKSHGLGSSRRCHVTSIITLTSLGASGSNCLRIQSLKCRQLRLRLLY